METPDPGSNKPIPDPVRISGRGRGHTPPRTGGQNTRGSLSKPAHRLPPTAGTSSPTSRPSAGGAGGAGGAKGTGGKSTSPSRGAAPDSRALPPTSPDGTSHLSIADLVLKREAQQSRLRDVLMRYNTQLRRRLEEAAAAGGAGVAAPGQRHGDRERLDADLRQVRAVEALALRGCAAPDDEVAAGIVAACLGAANGDARGGVAHGARTATDSRLSPRSATSGSPQRSPRYPLEWGVGGTADAPQPGTAPGESGATGGVGAPGSTGHSSVEAGAALGDAAGGGGGVPPIPMNVAASLRHLPGIEGGNTAAAEVLLKGIFQHVRALVADEVRAERERNRAFEQKVLARLDRVEGIVSDLSDAVDARAETEDMARDEMTEQHQLLAGEIDALREQVAAAIGTGPANAGEPSRADTSAPEGTAALARPRTPRTPLGRTPLGTPKLSAGFEGQPQPPTIAALAARVAALERRLADAVGMDTEASDQPADLQLPPPRVDSPAADAAGDDTTRSTAPPSLRQRVNTAVAQAAEALQAVAGIRAAVSAEYREAQTALTDDVERRLNVVEGATAAVVDRQARETLEMRGAVAEALEANRAALAQALADMHARYDGAVEARLQEITDAAEAHERRRRDDAPPADAERVELMARELGAMGDVIRRIAEANAPLRTAALGGRLDRLEANRAIVEGQVEALAAQFAQFLVQNRPRYDIAVGPEGIDGTGAPAPSLLPAVSFEQALAAATSELDRAVDRAALHASVAEVQRIAAHHPAVDDAGADMAFHTPTGRATAPNLLALASGAHVPTLAVSVGQARDIAASAPGAMRGDHARATRGSTDTTDRRTQAALELAEVRQQLSEREDALRKVQSVLQSIQTAFHSLTEKEMQLLKATASFSPTSSATADGESHHQAAVDALAQQKRTVFEREKKLQAQRNAVWREIVKLQDRRAELEKTVSELV